MVEILVLGRFCDWIGEKASSKGYQARKYHMVALLSWCVGEAIGLFAGMAIAPHTEVVSLAAIYLCALIGAGAGAMFAVMLARNLKPDPIRAALTVFPTNGK